MDGRPSFDQTISCKSSSFSSWNLVVVSYMQRPVPQDVDDFDERERIILEKMRKKEEEKRRLAASSGV